MLLIYFVLTHLLMNCKRNEKLRLYCNEKTRSIGSVDLDGGSIDFSAGSMPALKSVGRFIKVSAKYKMLLRPARPMICRSTFLYLADLTRLYYFHLRWCHGALLAPLPHKKV